MSYPNIESKADYDLYVADFGKGTEGMQALSSGACPGCEYCGLDEDCTEDERELASEEHFSWNPCDICGRALGGSREPAHYVDENDKIQHIDICVDCVYFAEYGRLDDSTMLMVEESES